MRQVDLSNITGEHHTGILAKTSQRHLQRGKRCVLALIDDDPCTVQGTAAHICQRRNLDDAPLSQFLRPVRAQKVMECVIQRTQIRIHLLRQISRKKSQTFLSRFNCRTAHDDPVDLPVFQLFDRLGNRQISLSRTCRTDADGYHIVTQCFYIILLPHGLAFDRHSLVIQGNHIPHRLEGLIQHTILHVLQKSVHRIAVQFLSLIVHLTH